MKFKLGSLIASSVVLASVLAVMFIFTVTDSTSTIRELTFAEMEVITGTGNCDAPKTRSAYDTEGGCNVNAACDNDDTPCGTDYWEYYTTETCSGAQIVNNWGCTQVPLDTPDRTRHNCYCKDRFWPVPDICKDDDDDFGKAYEAEAGSWCGSC